MFVSPKFVYRQSVKTSGVQVLLRPASRTEETLTHLQWDLEGLRTTPAVRNHEVPDITVVRVEAGTAEYLKRDTHTENREEKVPVSVYRVSDGMRSF